MTEMGFTEVLELGCSTDEIFWHMIHPDTASTVDPTIVSWRSEEFPPTVGTVNHLRAKGPLGIRLKMRSRFVEFAPPRRMVVQGVWPPFARWARQEHDLEAIPGGVRYTVRWVATPPVGFRLAYRLMTRRLHRGVIEGSKRLLERFGAPRGVGR